MSDTVLASWREGKARDAILDFVTAVTTQGGADFILVYQPMLELC